MATFKMGHKALSGGTSVKPLATPSQVGILPGSLVQVKGIQHLDQEGGSRVATGGLAVNLGRQSSGSFPWTIPVAYWQTASSLGSHLLNSVYDLQTLRGSPRRYHSPKPHSGPGGWERGVFLAQLRLIISDHFWPFYLLMVVTASEM